MNVDRVNYQLKKTSYMSQSYFIFLTLHAQRAMAQLLIKIIYRLKSEYFRKYLIEITKTRKKLVE